MATSLPRAVRVCLDVNIFVADFLSRRRGNPGGSSSKIIDLVRDGVCGLGPLQLVLSWRMLTTLALVLERLGEAPEAAWATCELLAGVSEFGPLREPPTLILGGSELLPLTDTEDVGVAETAMVGRAHLLITSDLDDFERGPRSALSTRRLTSKPNRKPTILMIESAGGPTVIAAVPQIAIGWLLGQTPVPDEVAALLLIDSEQGTADPGLA